MSLADNFKNILQVLNFKLDKKADKEEVEDTYLKKADSTKVYKAGSGISIKNGKITNTRKIPKYVGGNNINIWENSNNELQIDNTASQTIYEEGNNISFAYQGTDSSGNPIYTINNTASSGMSTYNPTGSGKLSMNRANNSIEGSSSTTLGSGNTASGQYSLAEGYSTAASGTSSHAEGEGTAATGSVSHAEGYYTAAQDWTGHAEGANTTAGYIAHAEGNHTTATGYQSHAEGYYTKASSQNQHVQGKCNIEDSSDIYADIVGNGSSSNNRNNAYGLTWAGQGRFAGDVYANYDFANGTGNKLATASDPVFNGTISLGRNIGTTVGTSSVALGDVVEASGSGSAAFGESTIASGTDSFAEGEATIASGEASHAEGLGTIASGRFSHAEGSNTIANGEVQHVQGHYNIEDTNNVYADIVGNGYGSDNRNNAYGLTWTGIGCFASDVYVNYDFATNQGRPVVSGPNRAEASQWTVGVDYILKARWNGSDWTYEWVPETT